MERRSETMHNTREQCRDYLENILEIIELGEVPDDLRSVAFQVVAAWVSAKQITVQTFGHPNMVIPGSG